MTTVKEFKDLGVEFVKGDVCSDLYRSYQTDWYISPSGMSLCTIKSFAWRPLNTLPDNPQFKYEQDFSQAEIKWRPSLDQSDSKVGEPTKPVFTQAMADAGELPPVGSRCLAVYKVGVETYEIEVTVAHINGNQVACIDANNDYLIQYTDSAEYFKPIDTRTPKQKAIDDMYKLWNECDADSIKASFEAIYDAGYRKQ